MSSEPGLFDGLELFYGEASNQRARVYARLNLEPEIRESAPYKLTGFVRGPVCEYARTLPANSPLVDQGAGSSLLAQAIVPDPCFWTPDMPARYLAHVELRRGSELVATIQRELAIRAFGPRGRSLFLDGRRWVLRGVFTDELAIEDLPAWRDARVALVVNEPSDELCREATRLGMLVVACVGGTADEILLELRRLSRFGAVASVLVQSGNGAADELRQQAPNLILALDIGRQGPFDLQESPSYFMNPWAEVAFVEVDDPAGFASRVGNGPHPVVAFRPNRQSLPPAEARAAIDELQRDLALFGDYAGYVV